MSADVFGDIIDADTVETAFRTTLQAWLPDHLAHQERRRDLAPGTLPAPKDWPTVSDFDIEANQRLPAIVIVSPGSVGTPERNQKGEHRKTWRLEVAVVLGDRTERDARRLAAMYLAAVTGAIVQGDRTLGGVAENARNVGPDDHAYGTTEKGAQRAIYGTAFEVTVRDFVNDRLGPTEPSEDPYSPEPFPPSPLEAEITVTAMEDTP